MVIVTVVTIDSLVAGELHIALEAPPKMCCVSINLFSLSFLVCVYVCGYVLMCERARRCAYTCACMWGPELDFGFLH